MSKQPGAVHTVQRVVREQRREMRAAEVATVRFETAPGAQMQIDFGEKLVRIADHVVKVYFLAAVLSFSRRIFVRAFLAQRGDDWREGIAAAFRHFGGVTLTALGDNAKALVLGRDRETGVVIFHPAYLAFCRDWDVEPRACGPYRARTKGKTESGVKFIKRNAIAGRSFESFAALEQHLTTWMSEVDLREHGTTHEQPMARLLRLEAAALRPLPSGPLQIRVKRVQRRVAHDSFVDIDTVRYSVPCRFVRDTVEVFVGDHEVQVFRGGERIATHRRSSEPHSRIVEPTHFDGLLRRNAERPVLADDALRSLGRTLGDYQAALEAS